MQTSGSIWVSTRFNSVSLKLLNMHMSAQSYHIDIVTFKKSLGRSTICISYFIRNTTSVIRELRIILTPIHKSTYHEK